MTTQEKQALLATIAKGKTKEALHQLLGEKYSKKISNTLKSTVVILASKYNDNEAANNRGILSTNDYTIEKTRITDKLVSLINDTEIPTPRLGKKRLLTFSFIISLSFCSLFFFYNDIKTEENNLNTSGKNSPIIKDANDVSITFGETETKQDTTNH